MFDGFFIHSLLIEYQESSTTLELVHNAESQAARLWPALRARNAKMAGPLKKHGTMPASCGYSLMKMEYLVCIHLSESYNTSI
jgi:hypothetical protein